MTDAEISRRLALAIGWGSEDVRDNDGIYVEVFFVFSKEHGYKYWREFDYRDPAVIWPIAERFDCFPVIIGPEWNAICASGNYSSSYADTAAKAVALAVIKAKEQK